MAKAKTTTKVVPIGTQIDELWALRESKRKLEDEVKLVEEKIKTLELAIIERLDKERTGTASSKRASVSINESIVPVTKDWELFMQKNVVEKGLIHLVERRPAVLACREVWGQGGNIPGLETFTKRKLNLRTSNK